MLEHLLFIPKQLLNTLMLGFRQIRSLATSLKTTWIRLTVDLDDPNISPEFLDRLSYEDDYCVLCKVAENPNTPPETLERLSYDKHWLVRCVAHNSNTPPETLDKLSYDKDWDVRWMVAKNPNTPSEALESLYYDKNYDVRWCVAENPNTPQYIKDHYKFRQFLKWHTDVPVT